jgi:alpha-ketoglutarate-dependent 2,4-dichlorophenoxyacetate dioxygenase
MNMTITPLRPGFAGVVNGIDLTRLPTPAQVAATEVGPDRYAVLIIHGQSFEDETQLASAATGICGGPPFAATVSPSHRQHSRREAMGITIRAAHPVFVGEVTGIDICRPLSRDQVAEIEAGMDQYAVLTFPDQPLTDEQQCVFSANFGELEVPLAAQMAKPEHRRFDKLELGDISNFDGGGNKLREREDSRRMYALANRLWHSDASFRAVGAGYTLLHARIVPSKGANTEFADMRAAYDALDAATKAECEDLITEHSIVFSREQIGFEVRSDDASNVRPVKHRLVVTHPVTGRKSLYLSSHIGAIVGWPVPEARAFIRDLTEHATQPAFRYSHKWRVNDLVMWDNRTVMHRATRFDDLKDVRDLRRTSIKGVGLAVADAAE